jgi:hypothetical protein
MSRLQKRLAEIEEQNALMYAKKQTNKALTVMFESLIVSIWKDYLYSIPSDSFPVHTIKLLTKKKLGARILHQRVNAVIEYLKSPFSEIEEEQEIRRGVKEDPDKVVPWHLALFGTIFFISCLRNN